MKWSRLFVILSALTLACSSDPIVPQPEDDDDEEEEPGVSSVIEREARSLLG